MRALTLNIEVRHFTVRHVWWWPLLLVLVGCQPERIQEGAVSVQWNADSSMVWVAGGTFLMGAGDDEMALPREFPQHAVTVDSFWMDVHEVTNAEFSVFVEATDYVTVAERPLDWEELRLHWPEGEPKPPAEDLLPGSMVFQWEDTLSNGGMTLDWWSWVQGADWKHPNGPGSDLTGLANHPVVHVCYFDALAYAKWSGKRLPREAEWEWAARGGLSNAPYPWGDQPVDEGPARCNYWSGDFPSVNTLRDGHAGTAPVGQFDANGYGIQDMAGNVWEICSDWYDVDHYRQRRGQDPPLNPTGPKTWNDPQDPLDPKRVMRGGSFLCNDGYCSSYRVTARMAHSQSTGMSHVGFRCVEGVGK